MEFDGYAIGGVSVGEPEPEMMKAVELTEPHLPRHARANGGVDRARCGHV
jgi:tRNA-guanine family transglycosylase